MRLGAGAATRRPAWLVRLAALLAVMALAASCASVESGSTQPSGGDDDDADAGSPQFGGELTYGLEAETTNGFCLPDGQLAISGIQVARSIYDTLTVPNGEGGFEPFLAESVTPNENFTEWTIQLRPNIRFHNGEALTAEVVEANMEAWRGQGPYPALLARFIFEDVADERVDGPLTVVVTTSRPWPAFPSYLFASGRTGIVALEQLNDPDTCARNLIGTGPFKLESWRVNNRMTLGRNGDYWRTDENGNQLPYLDELEFRPMPEEQQRVNSLLSGEIDGFHVSSVTGALVIDEMRGIDAADRINMVESNEAAEVGFVMLNTTQPPFDDVRVREALQLAVETELSNEIFSKGIATPGNGPFAPGQVGYLEDTGYSTSDPARARQLVEEYERDVGPVEFTITSQNTATAIQQIELSEQFWEDVGMTVRLTTQEQSSLIQTAIDGEFQGITFRNYPGLDPDNMYLWWYGGNPVNFARFDDPEINNLLDLGRETADPVQRQHVYEQLNLEVNREHYFFWTTWSIWAVPLDPAYHGVVGARAPGGSGSDYEGLALGHDMALMWKEQ